MRKKRTVRVCPDCEGEKHKGVEAVINTPHSIRGLFGKYYAVCQTCEGVGSVYLSDIEYKNLKLKFNDQEKEETNQN